MGTSINDAIQQLANNQKTLAAQLSGLLGEQNIQKYQNTINNQFNDIESDIASLDAQVATLNGYVSQFPIPSFSGNEIPSGLINGTNPVFYLVNTPTSGTLQLYVGATSTSYGQLALKSVHYIIVGNTITFQTGFIPAVGSWLQASYRFQG